jgi:hypothetical protein
VAGLPQLDSGPQANQDELLGDDGCASQGHASAVYTPENLLAAPILAAELARIEWTPPALTDNSTQTDPSRLSLDSPIHRLAPNLGYTRALAVVLSAHTNSG